jgi:hypothetical protein
MKYALLFYQDESKFSADEMRALEAEMRSVADTLVENGVMAAGTNGLRLSPPETATTHALRDGRVIVTDGPFSETKECLAGFWLIEAADLDEALGHAKRVPLARWGWVEVRPARENCGTA